VPSNDLNDEALARDAFLWIQNDMVRAGVELYKYRDRMSHGKVMVIDQQQATIGTTNLDSYAMLYNAEINLWVNDHRFAQDMTQRVWVQDIPNSKRVKVRKLRFWEKVRGRIMFSMRKFL
jgi:cardiolipin synthase